MKKNSNHISAYKHHRQYPKRWYFAMEKSTIASGGGQSTGGNFTLSASIGQTDASDTLTGGNYSLNGGFWAGINSINTDIIFKNGFEN